MSALGGLGNPLLNIAGFAVGSAAGAALRPPIQDLVNEAWQLHPVRPISPVQLAEGVAQGEIPLAWARNEAEYSGINGERFDRLVQVVDTGPGTSYAFELWRRGKIGEAAFRRALKRESFEDEWIDGLVELKERLLSSDELAMMQQQGFVDAERANREAALQGVTAERQQLRFQVSGLPPGLEMAMEMLRRSIIDRDTFAQIVREGHTKTKYTDELLRLEKRVLGAATYAELHLRGWISEAEMNQGGALTGYGPEDMQRMYLARGRPASVTQGYTAWARAAPGPYGGTFDRADFDTIIRQSNIRPEYAETLWHNRFNYPSLFQLRGAVQSGGLTPARALEIMHLQRFEDRDASAIVASWVKGKTAGGRDLTQSQLATEYEAHRITEAVYRADLARLSYDADEIDALVALGEARIIAAQTNAIVTGLRTLYVKHKIDRPETESRLRQLGITDSGLAIMLDEWTVLRDAGRPQLTAAQVRAAFRKGTLARAEALADLEALGYSTADANTYLDS